MIHIEEEAVGIFAFSLYDKQFCERAVRRLKRLNGWSQATINREVGQRPAVVRSPSVRKSLIFWESDRLAVGRDFDSKIKNVIIPAIKNLWRVELTRYTEVHIVRYGLGGHYLAHTDRGSTTRDRYFTVLLYLNDDFRGGETTFPSLDFSVKPSGGKAILFPANYVHVAKPLTAGEKFVMVSWILGPIPVDWI